MNKGKKTDYIILFFKIFPIAFVGFWVLTLIWVGIGVKQPINHTPQMMLYNFSKSEDSLKYKVEHQWVSIDSISQNLVTAVLASEDRNFFVHDGFSLKNDTDSIANNSQFLDNKTISQLTADAVFLLNGKTWLHRINETYYTMMMEEFWGKNRILEVYLNSALMGNGIFGAEAASHIYFDKKAGNLTKDEAAFIAAAMENPHKICLQNLSDSILLVRKNKILQSMSLMMNVKVGKRPIDEPKNSFSRPVYRRKWRG